MITGKDCWAKYGDPNKNASKYCVLWDVPTELELGVIPKKLYCNKDIIPFLEKVFRNIIERDLVDELKTFDGCFNIRTIRGYEKKYETLMKAGRTEEAIKLLSIHSWAIAIDINQPWNRLGQVPTMSPQLVACFTDAGFEWGGKWTRKDGMHFQLSKIPS